MWKEMLKAAKFAKKAHEGQKRAHGAPYYKHPMAVARILWDKGERNPALLSAAYLHDTLEDTAAKLEDLADKFGLEAASLVHAVTKQAGEEKLDYFKRVKSHGDNAMSLKLADREHNNSELHLAPPEMKALREKALAKTALMLTIFA